MNHVTSIYVWQSEHTGRQSQHDPADYPYHMAACWTSGKWRKREISSHKAYGLALLINRLVNQRKVRLYPFRADRCCGWNASRIAGEISSEAFHAALEIRMRDDPEHPGWCIIGETQGGSAMHGRLRTLVGRCLQAPKRFVDWWTSSPSW